jgi:hypothetical protein
MITVNKLKNSQSTKNTGDSSFGNTLFWIAGTIGIATKNGYDYAFPEWKNQTLFENPLPTIELELPNYSMPQTYNGYHFGFTGFDVPDNVSLVGEFGSEKYFKHCKDLIRHYFKMKPVCDTIEDAIIIHYRDYASSAATGWCDLDEKYYHKALEQFPTKRIVVISDNIEAAKRAIKLDCEYQTNLPVEDFYILSNAKYLIMANSTFSWWSSWLSQAKTVAPYNWFKDMEVNKKYIHTDLYCKDWIII